MNECDNELLVDFDKLQRRLLLSTGNFLIGVITKPNYTANLLKLYQIYDDHRDARVWFLEELDVQSVLYIYIPHLNSGNWTLPIDA